MTHITVKQVLRAVIVTLSISTMLLVNNVHAKPKTDINQEPRELTEAQKEKKEKNQAKNQARRTEKDYMRQLQSGEQLTAAELAEFLKGDASRIAATVDHPSSLGIAVIRELKKMRPDKLTKEILPALEKQLMQMLREDVEPPQMVSLISDSPANQILVSGRVF